MSGRNFLFHFNVASFLKVKPTGWEMVSDPNGTYLSVNTASDGLSMPRAVLKIDSFPRQRGKELDRHAINVIAVEKLLIGRLSKCHSCLTPFSFRPHLY